MPRLGVNVDHIATLRQQRKGDDPDPVQIALLAEASGADGIVMHLREDRRHIQERDVERFLVLGRTPLHLEMAATPEMVDYAIRMKVKSVCLVPEKREELTTEGGLDLAGQKDKLKEAIQKLHEGKVEVSLFIEPEVDGVDQAIELGADRVELHTGAYANFTHPDAHAAQLQRLRTAGERAIRKGLKLDAGHGLNYMNVGPVAAIPNLDTLNIGFSILSKSFYTGISQAVREMKKLAQG